MAGKIGFLPLSAASISLGAAGEKGASGLPESGNEETDGVGGDGGEKIRGGWYFSS